MSEAAEPNFGEFDITETGPDLDGTQGSDAAGDLDDILDEAVTDLEAVIDSKGGSAREGQIILTEDVAEAMSSGSHLAGIAPTGTGKSFAYLVPAVRRALNGQRTLISTESLGLQNQIEDEDAADVINVLASEVPEDRRPRVATLKGFSNYVCPVSLCDYSLTVLRPLTHSSALNEESREGLNKALGYLESHSAPEEPEIRGSLARIFEVLSRWVPGASTDVSNTLEYSDSQPLPLSEAAAVLAWAWDALESSSKYSDINRFRGNLHPGLRGEITISADECSGAECPLFELCAPRGSRRDAGSSDIVVTNHSLLGVQAARAIPAAFGSPTVGNFHNIIIDEAHTLPQTTRDQGAVSASRTKIGRIASAIEKFVDTNDQYFARVSSALTTAGVKIEEIAAAFVKKSNPAPGETFPLDESVDIDEELFAPVVAGLTSAKTYLSNFNEKALPEKSARRLRSAKAITDSCLEVVDEITNHRPSFARWVEVKSFGKSGMRRHIFNISPVDVSSALRFNLYKQTIVDHERTPPRSFPGNKARGDYRPNLLEDREIAKTRLTEKPPVRVDGTGYEIVVDTSVVCVSATLPNGFSFEAGLDCRGESAYESPFAEAYEDSAVFAPKPTDEDCDSLMDESWGKKRFSTKLHPAWASSVIGDLVEANEGRALILSSTSAAGQEYVKFLRTRLAGKGITVYSHWDGKGKDMLLEEFKADEKSVLVGSRGYMTGVNIKGESLSLVIVDRLPRAAGNVIDDARAESLAESKGLSEFEAKESVYVSDTKLLLEQAFGRLIRQIDDTGMVAILDPRLAKSTDLTMRMSGSRKKYVKLFQPFGSVISDAAEAAEWLRERRKEVSGGTTA